jgi:hypothetical protein
MVCNNLKGLSVSAFCFALTDMLQHCTRGLVLCAAVARTDYQSSEAELKILGGEASVAQANSAVCGFARKVYEATNPSSNWRNCAISLHAGTIPDNGLSEGKSSLLTIETSCLVTQQHSKLSVVWCYHFCQCPVWGK